MFTKFIGWLRERRVDPPPIPPDVVALAPLDDVEPLEQVTQPQVVPTRESASDLNGTSWFISYADAAGAVSKRRITILEVKESAKGDRSLMAKCHERNGVRQFRIDRIAELIDLATGEIVEPPSRVLGAASAAPKPRDQNAKDYAYLMSECRDPMRVLLLLARADGRVCTAEEEIILSFAKDVADDIGRPHAFDEAKMRTWLHKQTPDIELGIIALGRMGQYAPPEIFLNFAPHMTKVVNADGNADPRELAVLQIMVSEINEIAAGNR